MSKVSWSYMYSALRGCVIGTMQSAQSFQLLILLYNMSNRVLPMAHMSETYNSQLTPCSTKKHNNVASWLHLLILTLVGVAMAHSTHKHHPSMNIHVIHMNPFIQCYYIFTRHRSDYSYETMKKQTKQRTLSNSGAACETTVLHLVTDITHSCFIHFTIMMKRWPL